MNDKLPASGSALVATVKAVAGKAPPVAGEGT
jgi:hypothetical protein